MAMERIALYHDSFQNWKTHDIQKAQLILTDIPYQLGKNEKLNRYKQLQLFAE